MGDAPLAIVLAAGLSTRMKSKTPKVLHPVAGRPLVTHILRTVRAVGARPLVVLSKESAAARELFDEGTRVAIQEVARGTGDAVRVALAAANGDRGVGFVVYGDTPLLRPETLTRMRALVRENDAPLVLLAGEVGTDNAYGRVVRDERGDVERIVETRLATSEEKQIKESNLGAYAADLDWLRAAVHRLRPNDTGEIFLTDLVGEARREGKGVAVHLTDDPEEGIGVNTRADLAAAEAAMRKRIRDQHMLAGVTFRDPDSCEVDSGVRIAADVVIERGTILQGKTSIGSGSRVGAEVGVPGTTVGEAGHVRESNAFGASHQEGRPPPEEGDVMDATLTELLLLELVLVAVLAVLSASEAALHTIRRPQLIEELAARGRRGRRAGTMGRKAVEYLAAIQVAEFLMVFAFSGIWAAYMAPRLSDLLRCVFGPGAPVVRDVAARAGTVAVA